jgi:hypothetical protein
VTGNGSTPNYPATFFASFLAFAHRLFAAFAIAARPAADSTRFFDATKGDCRKAFLAAKKKRI